MSARSRRGSASRETLDRRNAKRGAVALDRDTHNALRAAARAKGWTMERYATAAILAALLEVAP